MSRFQSQNGFSHFVYANDQDCYLLPSLVRLDLNGYLYCLLKEQGYEAVYFISGTGEEYTLSLCDQPSAELYRKYGKKNKGFMGLFAADEDTQARSFSLPGAEDCIRRLQSMLKKGRRQAFVFRGETFREMAEKQPQEMEEFRNLGERYLKQNESILVLQLPMETVLRSAQEQPETDLQERTVILSAFSQDQMLTVARRVYLLGQYGWDWQEQDVKDLAAFLYTWYRKPMFRRETGAVLSENADRRFALLLGELSDSATWQKLRAAIEELRRKAGKEPLEAYLRRVYHAAPDPELCEPQEAEPEHEEGHLSNL